MPASLASPLGLLANVGQSSSQSSSQSPSSWVTYAWVTYAALTSCVVVMLPAELEAWVALCLLTLVCCPMAVLWAGDWLHASLVVAVEALALAFFASGSLLAFYVWFESVLVPLTLLVGLYGSGGRVRAAYLLWAYTIVGSVGLLLAVAWLELEVGTTWSVLSVSPVAGSKVLWLGCLLAFAVKTPLVPLHVWLLSAHTEAPLSTSLLLAAIVLKFATLGHWILMTTALAEASAYYGPLLLGLAVYSLVYASLATLRLVDTKAMVAMSSVAHMALAVLGLYGSAGEGLASGFLLSLGHALSSTGLFVVMGGVVYDRYHTRLLRSLSGLMVVMPMMALLLWAVTSCSMALPPTVGWVSELGILVGLWAEDWVAVSLALPSLLLTTGYSMWLVTRLTLGDWPLNVGPVSDVGRSEGWVLLACIAGCVGLGLMPYQVAVPVC